MRVCFVETALPAEALVDEKKAIMSMFAVLDGWKAQQAGCIGDASKWEDEIIKHHSLFVAAYGKEPAKPKHHRALHLG